MEEPKYSFQPTTFMPCRSYLIKHLENEEQLHLFAKMVFDTCYKKGLDKETALLWYQIEITRSRPINLKSLYLYHGKTLSPQEFVLNLYSDESLPKNVNCNKYCKEILGNNEICRRCAFYNGFANANMDTEISLLKFAVSSFDNLLFMKGIISDPKKVFRARLDFVDGWLDDNVPVVVPLPLFTYKVIADLGSLFFEKKEDEQDRLMSIKDGVIVALTKAKLGDYERLKEIPRAKLDRLWGFYCGKVLSASALDDVSATVLSITSEAKTKNAPMDESLPDIEESVCLFNSSQNDEAELSAGDTTDEPQSVEEHEEAGSAPDNDEAPCGDFSDKDLPFGPADKVDGRSEEPSSDEDNEDNGDDTVPDVPEDNEKDGEAGQEEHEPESKPEPQEQKTDTRSVKKAVPLILAVDDPLSVPHISTVKFSDPKDIDNAIALSNIIPTEVFRDDKNAYYFVFYIKQKFYICRPESEKVKTILGNRKLKKICWQPFDLYSLCAKSGVNVKGLFSILENELSAFPGPLSASYRDVISKYCDKFSRISDEELMGNAMPYYIRLYALQDYAVKKNGVSIEKMHDYFRVLGNSYHRNRHLKDYSRMFKMSVNGRVEFHDNYTMSSKVDGYEISFIVEGLKVASPVEFFMDLLLRFNSLKFKELQVVYISDDRLLLFAPTSIYEFVYDYILGKIDDYALDHGYKYLSVNSSSRFLSPNKSIKKREKVMVAPTSLNKMFDYLISISESSSENANLNRISIASLANLKIPG